MIVIAGGTGRLGTLLAHDLVARGIDVRVLTRDPARAAHLGDSVEIVTCDVRRRESLAPALEGATTVVSAIQGFAGAGHGTPESVDRDGNINLIDAAEATGADVILMSLVGAAADHPMELFRAKYAAEEHLRSSSVSWTIVRATLFLELWAEIISKGIVFGRGDNPINMVSVRDVADAVERAVVDPALRGQVLDVAGPANLTFNELAAATRLSTGRPTKVRHLPRALLRILSPFTRQARAALAMDTIDLTFVPRNG